MTNDLRQKQESNPGQELREEPGQNPGQEQGQTLGQTPGQPDRESSGQSPKKNSFLRRLAAELIDWIRILLIAAAGAWLCNHFLILNTQVPTGSMEDTIPSPSRIISSRVHYWFSDPERGDIILFDPPDGDEYYYVKRVIGMPGDTVEIVDGLVYLNGSDEPLDEPYLKETPVGSFGPYTVPEGCYFVMGDNRNYSNDSRYWHNPFVPRENIYARAVFGYWPRLFWVR